MSLPISNGGNAAAKAAYEAAKTILTQAQGSLNKEKTTESADMKKANSIFTQAQNIQETASKKIATIKTNADAKINESKGKVEAALQDVKASETVLNKQNELLKEKTDKKKQLESEHPELKKIGKALKKRAKTESTHQGQPQQQTQIGKDGKPIVVSAPQQKASEPEVENGSSEGGGEESYIQEYKQLCAEISSITQMIPTAQTQFDAGKEKLTGLNDTLKSTVDSGVKELSDHVTQTSTTLQGKKSEFNNIIISQATSKETNNAMSKVTAEAKQKADSAKSSATDKQLISDLGTVSTNLGKVKGETDKLAQLNNTHATTDLPNYQTEVQNYDMQIDGDATKEAEKLRNDYNEYMTNNLQPYLNKDAAKTDGASGGKDNEIASSITGKAGSLAQGALNGADMGDMLKDTLVSTGMEMAKGALDKVFPGLGAGLDMLGSIFGGFF